MPDKKIFFGTNLKMYKGKKETRDYLSDLEDKLAPLEREIRAGVKLQFFVIPSYTSLSDALEVKKQILIGAQNMAWEDQGQFTGEISPLMLKELSVDLVMVGHSERREIFREEDWMENQKVKTALGHGFITLLCIGESKKEKDFGVGPEILRRQLKIGLHGVCREEAKRLLIAYEPVWAIGTQGEPASPLYAARQHRIIKDCLQEQFPDLFVPVLYGGSVNRENGPRLLSIPEIDGLFVGRSAWEAKNFISLIRESLEHVGALKV